MPSIFPTITHKFPMPLKRPPPESQPRPPKAMDVLRAVEEEPENNSLFDPKVEISREAEKAMFNKLNEHRKKLDWLNFSGMAMQLSILYPDRKPDLELNENEFNGMNSKLNEYRRNKDWRYFSYMASRLSILYPDRKAKLKLDNSKFKEMKSKLNELSNGFSMLRFSDMAMCLLILYPNCKTDLDFDETKFNILKTELNKCRNKNWRIFSDIAMYLSIFYPDRKAELELGESEFNGMIDELNKWSYSPYYFSKIAKNLTILSSQRAQISEGGQIKLTRIPKPLVKARKPLPIVLKMK